MAKRIYQAVCLVCYTCILETSTKKKDCERACVGHHERLRTSDNSSGETMKLYGLFIDMPNNKGVYTPRFQIFTNKRPALKFAKIWRGVVAVADSRTFDGGTQYGIDAPTFRVFSTVIADYRVEVSQ